MPAEAGAGLEAHEPERLRRGGVDHFPDVDAHAVAELREFVHERDVHRTEDVLEELGQLRRLRRRDRDHGLERALVEGDGALGAGRGDPADDLGRRLRRPVRAARVDALGREGEEEVLARPASPDFRSRTGSTSSRVVPGYVVDSSTTRCPGRRRSAIFSTALMTIERSGSRFCVSGVGSAMITASVMPERVVVGGRGDELVLDQRSKRLRGHVLDVALAAVDRLDAAHVDVE